MFLPSAECVRVPELATHSLVRRQSINRLKKHQESKTIDEYDRGESGRE